MLIIFCFTGCAGKTTVSYETKLMLINTHSPEEKSEYLLPVMGPKLNDKFSADYL